MEIIGMGFVAFFMLLGSLLGRVLGQLIGTGGDVGGVGLAMLFMVLAVNYLENRGRTFKPRTENGIKFLSALYIPVIVAMASRLNVVGAINGGLVAILAGGVATIGAMFLVPLLSKLKR
ncbi:MAG: malonate transporter subunit MadL [Halanaerobium sp.]